jgi:hypothetical protein
MKYDTVSIVVNNSGGAFANGTTEDRTRLLLHELGHAMNYIFGPGTNGFDQTDLNAPGKSGGDDALVLRTASNETTPTDSRRLLHCTCDSSAGRTDSGPK